MRLVIHRFIVLVAVNDERLGLAIACAKGANLLLFQVVVTVQRACLVVLRLSAKIGKICQVATRL